MVVGITKIEWEADTQNAVNFDSNDIAYSERIF